MITKQERITECNINRKNYEKKMNDNVLLIEVRKKTKKLLDYYFITNLKF
jgi:hypothetical protein